MKVFTVLFYLFTWLPSISVSHMCVNGNAEQWKYAFLRSNDCHYSAAMSDSASVTPNMRKIKPVQTTPPFEKYLFISFSVTGCCDLTQPATQPPAASCSSPTVGWEKNQKGKSEKTHELR